MTDVEINPETRAKFLEPSFLKYPDLENQLIAEFKYCKDNNASTSTFGNDSAFTFPPFAVEAQLYRFHIKLPNEQSWSANIADYKKTSNTYLVYAKHMWDDNRYSILAVVNPAHTLMPAGNNQLISYFSACAERFHER